MRFARHSRRARAGWSVLLAVEAERENQTGRSKYGVRTDATGKAARTVDGILFASLKEARRYSELKLLERAGKIFQLQLQPRYRLCAWTTQQGKDTHLGDYVADFRYCNVDHLCVWGCQVEDVKGFKTPLYRWKKKHVEAQYGIRVREV